MTSDTRALPGRAATYDNRYPRAAGSMQRHGGVGQVPLAVTGGPTVTCVTASGSAVAVTLDPSGSATVAHSIGGGLILAITWALFVASSNRK